YGAAVEPLAPERARQAGGLCVPPARGGRGRCDGDDGRDHSQKKDAQTHGVPEYAPPGAIPPGWCAVLLACEARGALLGESGEAFLRILAREEVAELLRLALECAGREVEQSLGDAERDRALGRQLPGNLERVLEDGIPDRVHEADAERLLCVDLAAGEDQILRDAETADAREALRAAPAGDDAEVDLRLAEPRVRRGVTQVAA